LILINRIKVLSPLNISVVSPNIEIDFELLTIPSIGAMMKNRLVHIISCQSITFMTVKACKLLNKTCCKHEESSQNADA